MNITSPKVQRQTRIRRKIGVITTRPRLSVFRSNKYVYAQIIDKKGNTVLGLSEKALIHSASSGSSKEKATPTERAKELGIAIAKMALAKKITEVAFDKGRFAYHGKVAAIATGAREGGLKF